MNESMNNSVKGVVFHNDISKPHTSLITQPKTDRARLRNVDAFIISSDLASFDYAS